MRFFIFTLITLSASLLDNVFTGKYFVVWNIGQGQWTSAVDDLSCIHFDLGGEFFPVRKINQTCAQKENLIFLSHADWDHINALSKKYIYKKWASICLALAPLEIDSKRKETLWNSLNPCTSYPQVDAFTARFAKNSNDRSHVLLWQDVLLPGDSSKIQEKFWMKEAWIRKTRILILGHHGSKTSTSEELLKRLPKLRMAVASARWARYKHPHAFVMQALKKQGIAVLRTEDWGNIWFEKNQIDLRNFDF